MKFKNNYYEIFVVVIDICNAEKERISKRTLKRENVKEIINASKTLEKK